MDKKPQTTFKVVDLSYKVSKKALQFKTGSQTSERDLITAAFTANILASIKKKNHKYNTVFILSSVIL